MLNFIKNIFGISRYKLTNIPQTGQFKPGQVWQYKTRHHEPHSRLSIVKIERDIKNDIIIHVYLDQLKVNNPNHSEGVTDTLPHTPLTLAGLNDSVTQLEKTLADIPDQSEGYTAWLQAWNNGTASIFSMPVKEVIEMVENALCQGDESKP